MGANEELGLPRGKMETVWFAFDVDGTLRDNTVTKHFKANERIRSMLITLSSFKNVKIAVWSGGGELYANMMVEALALKPYVDAVLAKQDWKSWGVGKKVIAVDDIQDTNMGDINLIVREK